MDHKKKKKNSRFKKRTISANINAPSKIEAIKQTSTQIFISKIKKTITKNLFKNLISSKFFLFSLLLGIISLLIFLIDDKPENKNFVATINKFNSIDFNEDFRDDKPTSPLCGCLNDSIPHDGIMIPARYCKVINKREELSNFLITCPDEDVIGPYECYSFDIKIYRFNDLAHQEMEFPELCSLIESDSLLSESHDYIKNGFLSIITSNELEIYSRDEETIMAFIGSNKGSTSLRKIEDKYEGNLREVNIKNHCDLSEKDSIIKVPAIDFHSEQIYIKWKDSLNVLTSEGSSRVTDKILESYNNEIKNNTVQQSYKDDIVNIAVIEKKHNIRISIMPWSNQAENEWHKIYYSQFPEPENYAYFMNIPYANIKTLAPVKFDNIKPFPIPIFIGLKYNLNIGIKYFMDNYTYDKLYKKFTSEEGYYFEHDSNDFALASVVDVTNAIIDSNSIEGYITSLGKKDAHLLLEKGQKFQKAIDWNKASKTSKDTVKLGKYRGYFRYPPLHKENGIYFYTKLSYLKISDCSGYIFSDSKKTNFDNQVIEISDLQNVEYEYPNLFMSVDDNEKPFSISGFGSVKIDGHILKENFLENRYILMLSTLATIICFIITIFTLFKTNKSSKNKNSITTNLGEPL